MTENGSGLTLGWSGTPQSRQLSYYNISKDLIYRLEVIVRGNPGVTDIPRSDSELWELCACSQSRCFKASLHQGLLLLWSFVWLSYLPGWFGK